MCSLRQFHYVDVDSVVYCEIVRKRNKEQEEEEEEAALGGAYSES